jgi:hypothetical protein
MSKTTRWSLLSLGPALVLVGIAVWWSTRGPGPSPLPRPDPIAAAENAAKSDPRAREVLSFLGEKGIGRTAKLSELYVRLAGDRSATGVRALALNGLFAEPSLPLRLKGVLDAISMDPTSPREDPLWSKVTSKLAEQWTPEVFDKGRDLMLAEQRARAKRALVDSFATFVNSGQAEGLTPEQSTALMTDLIDVHAQAAPEQKPAIQEAVRKLGGNDPADLLAGKPPGELELQKQYEKNLQAWSDHLKGNEREEH